MASYYSVLGVTLMNLITVWDELNPRVKEELAKLLKDEPGGPGTLALLPISKAINMLVCGIPNHVSPEDGLDMALGLANLQIQKVAQECTTLTTSP
jgi:hypothetical protein